MYLRRAECTNRRGKGLLELRSGSSSRTRNLINGLSNDSSTFESNTDAFTRIRNDDISGQGLGTGGRISTCECAVNLS